MSERDLQRLLELVQRHLGRQYVDISDWLRSLPENELLAIEERLIRRDYSGLVQHVDDAARRFAAESHAQYVRSGREAAKWLDEQPALRDKLIRFDAVNERAVQAARRNEMRLVAEWRGDANENARQIVHRAMQAGTEAGTNPREIARQFRDSIGLTPQQEIYLDNYRRALATGNFGNAMGRELHDDRSNAMLRRLQREGGGLTEAQISKMTERYRKNLIAWRAENIARTEASSNVHAGLEDSYKQAIERGDIEADALSGEWIPGPRTKDARDMHRSAALLAQRPKIGEPFVLDDGTRMMRPGDPAGGAEHTNHCRCTWAVTLR